MSKRDLRALGTPRTWGCTSSADGALDRGEHEGRDIIDIDVLANLAVCLPLAVWMVATTGGPVSPAHPPHAATPCEQSTPAVPPPFHIFL